MASPVNFIPVVLAFLFPAGFLFAAITLPGPDGDNWPFSILDVRLMA